MIKNLFIINLKAFLAGLLRLRRKNASLSRRVLPVLILTFAFASIMMTFGTLFYTLRDSLFSEGVGWFYFSLQAILSFALSVFGTIFSAQALFTAKDNELLMSMPIKPFQILISRLLVILLFEYIFELIIAVPAFIIWVAGGLAAPSSIVLCLIGYALLPLMALSIACLVAWILSSILMRFKQKNILTMLLSISFLLLYLRLYSQLQHYLNILLNRGVEIAEAFRRAMPPFYAFGASIVNHSLIDACVFFVWAFVPFALTVALILINYQRILTTNRGLKKTVYREKAAKVSGACFALTKKELAYYSSKPMVVLNTSISSLFMLIGTVMLIVRRNEFIDALNSFSSMTSNMPLPVFAAGILTFMGGINNLSASLISLEGRHLWIAKTIPVQPKVIFLSKIYTHLLTSAVPCLILSVTAIFLTANTITDGLLILVLPQTYIILTAVAGLAVNMIFPRFDWINEMQPVKQGASAMIMIFGAMGFALALLGLYVFIFRNFIGIMSFAWILAAIFTACSFLIWRWLSTSGAEKLIDL